MLGGITRGAAVNLEALPDDGEVAVAGLFDHAACGHVDPQGGFGGVNDAAVAIADPEVAGVGGADAALGGDEHGGAGGGVEVEVAGLLGEHLAEVADGQRVAAHRVSAGGVDVERAGYAGPGGDERACAVDEDVAALHGEAGPGGLLDGPAHRGGDRAKVRQHGHASRIAADNRAIIRDRKGIGREWIDTLSLDSEIASPTFTDGRTCAVNRNGLACHNQIDVAGVLDHTARADGHCSISRGYSSHVCQGPARHIDVLACRRRTRCQLTRHIDIIIRSG